MLKMTSSSRWENSLIIAVSTIFYLLLSAELVGFKPDQLFLAALFNVLYFASSTTRKLILGFLIFIVYWVLFDYMKALPNYMVSPVHIEGIYHAEQNVFGIRYQGNLLTPNEYLLAHQSTLQDVVSGIFYLCWIPVPLAFAGYLFFKQRYLFLQFALSFFLVNIIGFIIYYIYPAAPPWYVQQHGFGFIPHTAGNTAGLQRFDAYFGIPVFAGLYAKSSNVFAAMPSLHSAYPVVVLYYGIKAKLGRANIFFAVVMLGIWYAAVYSSHHYVLDVLAGIACAILGILVLQKIVNGKSRLKGWVMQYLKAIE